MRASHSLIWAFVLSLCVASSLYAGASSYRPLEEKLDGVQRLFKNDGVLGLSIFSTKKQQQLLDIKADSLFRPASTLKLLVTSTALHTLGVSYMPKTALQMQGTRLGRRFAGATTIFGGGDPNISARYFGDALKAFTPWIDTLKAMGIDTIEGNLTFDYAFYPDAFRPTTWKDEFFLKWYGAEVAALTFNDNCVDLSITPGVSLEAPAVVVQSPAIDFLEIDNRAQTVKGSRQQLHYYIDSEKNKITISGTIGVSADTWTLSVPVKSPPLYFETAFRAAMAQSGITIVDAEVPEGSDFVKKVDLTTAPLLSILDEVNQRSQNLHAEMLLRNLGGHEYSVGSLENGLRVEREFLTRIGVDSSQYHLLDGSGLSYDNRITPHAMTQVLNAMSKHPRSDLFFKSLAVPGISGVSGKRLPGLKYKNLVRFKTGFVNFTQGLVGYIQTPLHDTLAVALYLNEYTIDDYDAQMLMDSLWCEIVYHYNEEQESLLKARQLWHEVSDNNFMNRLELFSEKFIGEPYVLGPTGEGALGLVEQKPLINMFAFDCVTYIESALALARAESDDAILDELIRIRYKQGHIYYATRKHYFVEDWLRGSEGIVSELRVQGDTVAVREMDKQGFYASKNWRYKYENPQTELNYLPIDSAISQYGFKTEGEKRILGVGLVGTYQKIWVTHTGFLVLKPGELPVFRHASFTHKKVEDVPFAEYLKTRLGKVIGVVLFEFLEPRSSK